MQKHLWFVLMAFLPAITFAQDPQLTQFYSNPIYTNPAFAGSATNARIVLSARNQYVGLANNYKTGVASFDMNMAELNGGVGLIATTDIAGDGNLTTTTASAVYAYHVQLNRYVSMRAGIEASYYQRGYDFSRFRFGDQIDDRYGFVKSTQEPIPTNSINLINFGTGVLFYSNQFFGGVAIHNLTEPNQSFYYPNSSDDSFKLPRRYTVHGGGNIYLTNQRNEQERVTLSPNILYMQQRSFNQLNLGMYIKKQALTTGLWFRQTSKNTDALIGLIGLKFTQFRIGYSYDVTISGARTATQGSHELSAAIEIIRKKRTKKTFKAMRCPEF